ncbi:hypothetical protein BHE74_00013119, partial [Ensete ventricosum]
MGSSVSHAAAPPPPPPPSPAAVGLAVALPPKQDEKAEPKNVDWLNLPCPIPFEEIQREALSGFPDDCVTGKWIACYRAVPPKSTVGSRLREKLTVGGRLREKSVVDRGKKREEEEEEKKKEEEEKKKEDLLSPCHLRLHAVVACGSPTRRPRPRAILLLREETERLPTGGARSTRRSLVPFTCYSATSVDVEEHLYRLANDMGITVITSSQLPLPDMK